MTQTAQPGPAPSPTAKRNWFLRHWFISLLALGVGSCAFMIRDRTVSWEEEVLLNTGETIVVNKEVSFSIRGQPGNPMKQGYVSDDMETTSFKYQGKNYTYSGDAVLLVIAISPQKVPVLLAAASSRSWYAKHQYKCVNPYYVMLVPSASGKEWTWPDRIETWTYNLPTNLMRDRDHPSAIKRRYTLPEKAAQMLYLQDPRLHFIQKIDPLYISDICKGSN